MTYRMKCHICGHEWTLVINHPWDVTECPECLTEIVIQDFLELVLT